MRAVGSALFDGREGLARPGLAGGERAFYRLGVAWRRPRRAPAPRAAIRRKAGPVHGGKLVARALADRGVDKLFTLSGGHLFSIYDGCVAEGIEIIDTRHEQSAAWAAEGYAKATRKPGIAALTAGPGVTNGMSAMAGAKFNRSPLVVLGGRAPEMRWGSGSLQEIDHLPFVGPVTKSAETVKETGAIPEATVRAIDTALTQPTGPTYVDFPLDVVFMEGEGDEPGLDRRRRARRRRGPTRPRRCSPRPSAR